MPQLALELAGGVKGNKEILARTDTGRIAAGGGSAISGVHCTNSL